MAGFTKAPSHGAAYAKRGIAKGVVLMSRAPTRPRVEYVSGLLQDLVAGLAKGMMNANQHQHEIGKLNAQLATLTDGDEATDLSTLKERKVNKGFAINGVLVHSGEYFTAYAEQARMFDVRRGVLVELTGRARTGLLGGNCMARTSETMTSPRTSTSTPPDHPGVCQVYNHQPRTRVHGLGNGGKRIHAKRQPRTIFFNAPFQYSESAPVKYL